MKLIYGLIFLPIVLSGRRLATSLKIKPLKHQAGGLNQNHPKEKSANNGFFSSARVEPGSFLDWIARDSDFSFESLRTDCNIALMKQEAYEEVRMSCPECEYVETRKFTTEEVKALFGNPSQCKICSHKFTIHRGGLNSSELNSEDLR